MSLPFTHQDFFDVFRRYNDAVWPAQIGLVILALLALGLLFARADWRGRAVSAILAALWFWMGIAYHFAFFRAINPAAVLFGGAFVAAAGDFGWNGVVRGRLQFAWPGAVRGTSGLLLVGYALLGYPALAVLAGQRYPELPTFGLPCPTTIFTAGVLLFLVSPFPRRVLLVPLVWTLIGAQAALFLGVPQDFGLIAAGAALASLALSRTWAEASHA